MSISRVVLLKFISILGLKVATQTHKLYLKIEFELRNIAEVRRHRDWRQETELKPLSEKDLTEKQCPNQRLRLLYKLL